MCLSVPGQIISIDGDIAMIDYWAEKFPRFKPFHLAFTRDAVREKANQYLVLRKMGKVPEECKEAEALNQEIRAELDKMRSQYWQAEMQKQKIAQYQKQYLWNTQGSSSNVVTITSGGTTTTWKNPWGT